MRSKGGHIGHAWGSLAYDCQQLAYLGDGRCFHIAQDRKLYIQDHVDGLIHTAQVVLLPQDEERIIAHLEVIVEIFEGFYLGGKLCGDLLGAGQDILKGEYWVFPVGVESKVFPEGKALHIIGIGLIPKEGGSGVYNGESRVAVMETFHGLIPLGILMDLVQEKMGSAPTGELLRKVGK